jgi:hypothetical protein
MNRRIAGAFVAVIAFAGCGGGGSDGQADNTIHVTFNATSLTFPTWDDWPASGAYVKATVSPLPSQQPYVFLLDSGSAFVPGTAVVTALGGGTFGMMVDINPALAPGEYRGTLTVKLCHDPACTQPYALSGGTLPYDITVLHAVPGLTPPTATVTIDDVTVASTNGVLNGAGVQTYTVSMASGHTVELLPSMPFLTLGIYRSDTNAVSYTPRAPTQPGAWRATLSLSPGATTGYAILEGRSDGGGTVQLTVNLTP